jgi:hypothetical protein
MRYLDRKALEQERAYLQERLAAIEVLLSDGEPDQGPPRPDVEPRRHPVARKSRNGAMGIRPAIRDVLTKGPSAGMRPIEVTKGILALGFEYKGRTPFNMRVSTEMSRMTKNHELSRTKRGRYKLKKSEGQD